MPRNPGSTIDVQSRRICDRDGRWYPLDRVVLADGGLFHARPIEGGTLFTYHRRWLLPAHGWAFSQLDFLPHVPDPIDWYIETDLIDVNGASWRVRDGYLDVEVYDGLRYQVRDAGELAEGMAAGEITLDEVAAALTALDRLCAALLHHGFSAAALLAAVAPGLPRPEERP